MQNNRERIRALTQFSILLALEAVICFTPLGSVPIGAMVATLMHIPVIITAIMLGTKAGALMGFFSGLFSFLIWTFMPPTPLLAFVFTPFYSAGDFTGNAWSLVICFVPRILIGVVAGAVYTLCAKKKTNLVFSCILSGVLGSLTTTVLVLGGIYVFFGQNYAAANGMEYSALLGAIAFVAATNGVAEVVIAGIVSPGVCVPLNKLLRK
jgi:uncharacterized membrane protein